MVTCGQEFPVEIIERIRATVAEEPAISRRELSRRVCSWLDWRDPAGQLKSMSCRVALTRMARRGVIALPKAKPFAGASGRTRRRRVDVVDPDPVDVTLNDLGTVELILVDAPELSAVWNELLDRHHYLGSGPLCGAQIRYLLWSTTHGWLGGLAFSAAAWHLKARDEWIGWTADNRGDGLQRIVCNSRFLILPQVQVPNLASHCLSLAARHIGEDWRQRYGVTPVLLETFVEQGRFQGTCYRAANWILVGTTCGRGRQDRNHRNVTPVKDVYVLPLCREFRRELGFQAPESVEPKPLHPAVDWVGEEFEHADLGDRRLDRRLVILVRDFYAQPQADIPQACRSRAKTKAAYRFLEHPDITMDKVLESHYASTIQRAACEPVVLAVQDTTSLNYTAHSATMDLGPIGTKLEAPLGLLLHDTMAFTPEGTPLGLLDAQCWARDPEEFGKSEKRHQLPIEEKESIKWLRSFEATGHAAARCPQTTFVSVADREADVYELFERGQHSDAPRLLVRAKVDRALKDGQAKLWETVEHAPVAGHLEIQVPRRKTRPARPADLEIRFAPVRLAPPRSKSNKPALDMWAVLARESHAPEGEEEPVEWLLLCTLPVRTFEEALQKVEWYHQRWNIEIYHRTIKSGCRIEERQLGTADRIETCLAIDMVVAWRVYYLCKLGREVPDAPCTVFFEEAEWKALNAYITKNPDAPPEPPTLRDAMRMVATMGGFLGRKSDKEPGTKSLWLGLQKLDAITEMWKLFHTKHDSRLRSPPVSSRPTYG